MYSHIILSYLRSAFTPSPRIRHGLLDASPGFILGLASGDDIDLRFETRTALLGLPSRGPIITEHGLNLFQCLAASLRIGLVNIPHLIFPLTYLWICEPELSRSQNTHDSKHNKECPSYVLKGRGNDCNKKLVLVLHPHLRTTLTHANGKVEQPIAACGDAHSPGSRLKRPYFRGVDPADGRKRHGINDDHEI